MRETKQFDLLIVCDHYRPGFKAGGPIVSVENLTRALHANLDILVFTRGRDIGDRTHYPCVKLNSIVNKDGISVYYVKSLYGYIKAMFLLRYRVIYLNSFFSAFCFFFLVSSLFSVKCRRIIAPRGELGRGAMSIKSFKKTLFSNFFSSLGLTRKVTFHATSKDESERIFEILRETSVIIPNIGHIGAGLSSHLEKRRGHARLIYLSRIARKKNLEAALEALLELESTHLVEFDIYGPIEDEDYWKKCSRMIQRLPRNISVSYRGVVQPTEVSTVLGRYHALLLPTLNENYGHVIVEAMDNGVLPIISDQTPWRNLKVVGVGWDVPLSNVEALTAAVRAVIDLDGSSFRMMSRNAQEFIRNCSNGIALQKSYMGMFMYNEKLRLEN